MFIRMLGTHPGSPNGIEVRDYFAGEVYDVPASLGKAFVADLGWAEPFSPSHEALPIVETAMLGAAPENKQSKVPAPRMSVIGFRKRSGQPNQRRKRA